MRPYAVAVGGAACKTSVGVGRGGICRNLGKRSAARPCAAFDVIFRDTRDGRHRPGKFCLRRT